MKVQLCSTSFFEINQSFSVFPESYSFIDSSHCNLIWNLLLDCRRFWKERDPGCGFYTFGTPSYMDAGESLTYYIYQSAQTNCFLKPIFNRLRPALVRKLSTCCDVLEQFVMPLPFASIPGFHIFAPALPFEGDVESSYHQDRQHEFIVPLIDNILGSELSPNVEILSFTLPIKLPLAGAGLCFCEKSGVVHRFPYVAGEIVLHGGQNDHKIDDGYASSVGDVRATMQGHAVRTTSGKLYYYW